jgi:DUF1680 family protein
VNGRPIPVEDGAVRVTRSWQAGDEVRLELPMASRWTAPDPRIDAVRGCLAVERGPLVLCLESPDLPDGAAVEDVRVVADRPPADRDGAASVQVRRLSASAAGWPFGSPEREEASLGEPEEIALIPYLHRANRGPATMRVWLPVA